MRMIACLCVLVHQERSGPQGSHTASVLRRVADRHPRVRQLWAADADAVEVCLEQSPQDNVYVRSEIRHGALRQGSLVGVEHPGERGLHGVVMLGPLVVPWAPASRDLVALAQEMRPAAHRIQLLVGPRDQVAALQELLAPQLRHPRLVRAEQPHYAVDSRSLLSADSEAPIRQATIADFEQVVEAGAAMHLEEVGFDPLSSDPVGFRQRVLTLIRRGWVRIWVIDGQLVFKAECAAVTPEAVQLQGVWTRPDRRGRGLATAGMATVCRQLLGETQSVTLFVNDFNLGAVRVYERVGFERIGTMRSVLF